MGKRRQKDALVQPETVRRFWHPSGVPGSTWCLGWDRPSPGASSAGARWPRDGVGHLGFTGCSLWIDPPRARWVVLLSNRVHPTRANDAIKAFRPVLHDAVVAALDGPA
jgi:CubicO group peptidase (beta-lactamase class C family)